MKGVCFAVLANQWFFTKKQPEKSWVSDQTWSGIRRRVSWSRCFWRRRFWRRRERGRPRLDLWPTFRWSVSSLPISEILEQAFISYECNENNICMVWKAHGHRTKQQANKLQPSRMTNIDITLELCFYGLEVWCVFLPWHIDVLGNGIRTERLDSKHIRNGSYEPFDESSICLRSSCFFGSPARNDPADEDAMSMSSASWPTDVAIPEL